MKNKDFLEFVELFKETLKGGDVKKIRESLAETESYKFSEQLELAELFESLLQEDLICEIFSTAYGEINPVGRAVVSRLIQRSPEKVDLFMEGKMTKDKLFFLAHVLEQLSGDTMSQTSVAKAIQKVLSALSHYYDSVELLVNFLRSDVREVQVSTITALGKIGTAEAVSALKKGLHKDESTDILVINKLAVCSDGSRIDALVDLLGEPNARVRNYAETKLRKIGSEILPSLVKKVEDLNISDDHLVFVLNILSELGDERCYLAVRAIVNGVHSNPNVRVAAYNCLAKLGDRRSLPFLVDALKDPVDDVAFTVCSFLNAHVDESLVRGIRNVIASGLYSVERFAEVFLFTGSDALIEETLDIPEFASAVAQICSWNGMDKYRKRYGGRIPAVEERVDLRNRRGLYWAIDDAPAVLQMYERFCAEKGYPLALYDGAQKALQAMEKILPDFIFVDLNMPDMDGISFAKRVRENYSTDQVPIVLVTTQSDVVDDETLQDGLFNAVIQKPFSHELLDETVTSIISEKGKKKV